MNKKLSRVALLASCTVLLASCNNNKDMASISEETAITRAAEILARQNDSTLFTLPTNFVVTNTSSLSASSKKVDSGEVKDSGNSYQQHSVNADELKYRRYEKTTSPTTVDEKEMFVYYDKEKGILYEAINSNGYKTRVEESIGLDEAKIEFNSLVNSFKESITLSSILTNFKLLIESLKSGHEKYKNENDQYVNYYLGSDSAKSLQTKYDTKLKQNNETTKFSGYYETHNNIKMNDDKLTSYEMSSNVSLKFKDNNNFYENTSVSRKTTITYGNASITLPDIGQYTKK